MKLHLPKQLFTALLTALTLAAPTALTLGSAAWGGWSGDSFTLESATTDSISTEGQTPGGLGFFIRTGENADMAEATVTLLQLQAGDNLYIDGSWQTTPVEFTGLTIETLSVKDEGSATLNVYEGNTAYINALTGSLSSVTNSGTLTFGAADNTTNSFALGNITNSGMLTINGPVTLASASTLNLAESSNLVLNNAGTIVLRNEANNAEYKKVTGTGTLTIGNGTVIELANTSRPGATGAIEGSVVVLGGGKLLLSGNSTSLLGYNEGNATTATDNVYLRGSAGNVATMEITSTQNQHLSTKLYLQGYAQVTGESGLIETYNGKITATGTNNTIYSRIQVNRDLTVEVTGESDALEISGRTYSVRGTMTKGGKGTLTFTHTGTGDTKNSFISYTNQDGITNINAAESSFDNYTNTAGETNINGATTVTNYTHTNGTTNIAVSASITSYTQAAGETNIKGGASITTLAQNGGDINVSSDSASIGTLSQSAGTFTLEEGAELSLGKVTSAVTMDGTGTLILTGSSNYAHALTFTSGVTGLHNFTKAVSGTLALGSVDIFGPGLYMNSDNGSITAQALGSVATGAELIYGTGSDTNYLGNLTTQVTLNFYEVADRLSSGINLGFSRGDKTLEEVKALLTVNGLDSGSYTLSEQNGNVYLTSTSALTSGWDDNWGGLGLTKLPTSSTTLSVATAGELPYVTNSNMKFHMLKNTFEAGEVLSVTLEDTTGTEFSGALVGGFATTTTANSHGSLVERDVWIRAKSGVYHSIIGGNHCDNWNGGLTAVNFEGNTHILVEGATVGTIIGGNNRDGKAPVFNGNSFISVMSGNVTSSIIGAGTNAHNNTTTFNGDTNIFVYVPLDTNDTTVKLTDAHAVIGGGAKIANSGGTSIINGDTNITVDLSAYTGDRTTFIKNIIGGHYNVPTATINGTTNITITGKSGVSFTGQIVGGSYTTGGFNTNTSGTKLTLNNGTYTGIIVGGDYSTSTGTKTVGSTDVTITGGSYSGAVVAGSYTTGAATTNITSTGLTISDGSFSNSIVGGSYTTVASNNTVGTTNVNIKGGNFTTTSPGGAGDTPYTHVIAGGHLLDENVAGTVMNATSTNVTITGGTVGMDIFGGHVDRVSQSSGNALTATLGSATVTLNGAGASVQNIYGGSFTQRDNTNVNITQGNIVVDLIAGTVNGNVYAGGRQVHNSKITTENTEVRISDGVAFTSDSAVVSGAYQIGCTTTNHGRNNPSTVTGTKTLVFNGASQDRSGITFDSFDTIQVTNADAGVTLNTLTNITDLTKTGEGSLMLSGTLGTADAALETITVANGSMNVMNTSYATDVNMIGGNLTYGGTGVTHTITGELITVDSPSAGKQLTVQSGTSLKVGTLMNTWGIKTVVDGTLEADTMQISYARQNGSTSGTGSITTGELKALNNGSRYEVSVNNLSVGANGISVSESSHLYLNSATTTVAGAVTIAEGSSLNIETGSVTLNGGISSGGTVALSGGSLALGSGEGVTNEIAQFNYSGGTLTHSGLTVTNATFSDASLDNTANGTLTLNGTLNVTNIGGLTTGEGSYSGGSVEGNGYYTGSLTVITGGNLGYGENFAVQLNGSELTTNSENDTYYTKSADSLTLNVTDTSTFIVNTGTESIAFDSAKSYYVASEGRLEFTGQQCTGDAANDPFTASVSGIGTVALAFDSSDHNEYVDFGSGFNGTVEVSGYMRLDKFNLGGDATIKLMSGQVWTPGNATVASKILLAGETEDAFTFAHGNETLTLSGAVTGSFLTASVNITLTNVGNNITQVKVTGGTTNLNAGTYGTVKSGGGTTNINGGTVGALTIYGGSINLSNGGTLTSLDFTSSDGTSNGSAGGSVHFKKNGETATTYTVGTITTSAAVSWTRSLTVDKGVTLNVNTFNNAWGMDTMTIDGELAASTEIKLATGNQNTSKNIIAGSGIVSTPKLIIDNAGTYNFSGVTLKIGEGGLVLGNNTWYAVPVLKLGAMTIEATDDWTAASGFTTNLAAAEGTSTVVNTAGHRVTINGSIEGSGALTKSGEGTLALSGTNTYTGATTVEAGILEISKVAAVNSSSGVEMESGAGLKYTGSGAETLSTPLSGAGSFTMAGTGTLTLSGANTYTGATSIESGTLQIAELSAISSSSGVSISSGAELKYTGGDATFSNALSGAGSFTVAGSGTLTVNTALSHTGGTTIESGTLKQSGNVSVLGESTNVTVKNGASLDVNGKEAYYNLTLGGGDSETAAVLTNTGSAVNEGNKQLYSITLADDATVSGTAGMCMIAGSHGQAYLTLNGHTLTKTGGNTFTISRAEVTEGTIKVLQGKVLAKHAGSSGDGALNLSAASIHVGTQSGSTGMFELDSVDKSVKDLTFDGGKVSTLNQKTLTATGTTQVKSTGGTLSGNLTATDKVSFENGGALKLGTSGKLKVQNAENSAQYIELSGSADASGITATSSSSQLAQLAEDASFTIQDMTLTNTTVTAATVETKVNLQNVEGSAALLAKGAFTLNATPTVGMAPSGESRGTLSYSNGLAIATDKSASLTLNLDVVNAVAGDAHGTYDLTITLSGFGEGFAVTEDILGMVGFDSSSWLGQALVSQKAEYSVVTEQTPATAGEGGVPTVSYAAGTGGNVGTLTITIAGLNVPEPASATLGLAALMMLCARRRRKA